MPIDLIYKKERFSQDVSYVVNAPIGSILIWSGTEDNVPEGWNICNGQNGTIDLSDKTALYIQKTGVTPSDYMTREDVEGILDEAGSSLPPGGTTGQVLAKASNEDGDVEWQNGVTMEDVESAISTATSKTVTVEEYDANNGWHVRKYSDGFVYMYTTIEKQVTESSYTLWGGGYAIPANEKKSFPFALTKKYGESCTNNSAVAGAITQWLGGDLSGTASYGLWRGTALSGIIRFMIQVFGRWK